MIKLLVTVGPSTSEEKHLRILKDKNVDFIRVNMSHSSMNELKYFIKLSKKVDIPFVIDTEGSQIRTGELNCESIFLKEGSLIELHENPIIGSINAFSIQPKGIINKLELGDLIHVDFDGATLRVHDSSKLAQGYLLAIVVTSGHLFPRKSVVIDPVKTREISLPILSPKDIEAIKLGLREKIHNIAFSYVHSGSDIDNLRNLIGNKMKIISKIECSDALKNLDEIIEKSDYLLIDRGDLSKEVKLEKIPFIQMSILSKCRSKKKGVFIATNLLESMVENSRPTRAEIQDITSAIVDGAYGLTLSAETAIGKYPIRCVNLMKRIIKHVETVPKVREISNSRNVPYEKLMSSALFNDNYLTSTLEKAHGGNLVNSTVPFYDHSEISQLPKIQINKDTEMDVFQIATGAFSPIEGFINEEDLHLVLDKMKLSNGYTWPLPIILDVEKKDVEKSVDAEYCLVDCNNNPLAILKIEQVYTNDKKTIAQKIYGTEDLKHPGVSKIFSKKPYLVAGKVTLLNRTVSELSQYELTPLQLRKLFVEKGWEKIAGFHTRNVPHRGHEQILLKSIEDEMCDGILLHPVIGTKKRGDFNSKCILKSYEILMQNHLPKDKYLLSAFNTYSHYAGPREAVFTAICRKNYGCTHFIVGRDHTGVSGYYNSKDSHKVFQKINDLGIEIIFFDEIVYSKSQKNYYELPKSNKKTVIDNEPISGTGFREYISRSELPPSWYAREDVSNMLLQSISNGEEVFV
tara:strand:+ start:422 stop:2656 length:2235 start_codon:yes stop_codon:yes gene_type:complete